MKKKNQWQIKNIETNETSFFLVEPRSFKKPKFRFTNFLKSGLTVLISVLIIYGMGNFISTVLAIPPGSSYTPGQTLAPTCSPGDPNCTVTTPAVSGANSDITSLGVVTGIDAGASNLSITANASGEVIINDAGEDVDFRVEASGVTDALFVRGSDGNVGIGTTSPATLLHVEDTSGILNPTIIFESGEESTVDGEVIIALDVKNSVGSNNARSRIHGIMDGSGNSRGSALTFHTRLDSDGVISEQMRIDSSGNVGIGDTDPDANLEVVNDFMVSTDSSGNGDLFIVQSGGNVGIGIVSPKTKLTVEGTVTLKEQATADADTAAYGQLWVKNDTPNTLYFTDDDGTDTQLGVAVGFTSKCSVYRNNTQTITTATDTKVELDTEDYDVNDEFDSSTNYRFQPAVTGYYHVSANVLISSLGDGKALHPKIYKNGTVWKYTESVPGAIYSVSACISCDMYLLSTDYIELYVYHNHGSNINIPAGRNTFMDVHRIY